MFLKHIIPKAAQGGSLPAANGQLGQCLLLAVLLHLWLVLMLGNATGTAKPGDGVWGRLNVTLAGNKGETGKAAAQPLPPLPEVSPGPPGQAKQQRYGGRVRPQDDPARRAPRPTTPGAAEVGPWRAERVEAPSSAEAAQAGEVAKTAEVAELAQALPSPAPLQMAAPAAQQALTRLKSKPVTGLDSPPVAPQLLDQLPLPQARVRVMEAAPVVPLARAKAEAIERVGPLPSAPRPASRLTPALIAATPQPALPQFKPDSLPALAAPAAPSEPPAASAAPIVESAPAPPAPLAPPAEPVNKQMAAPPALLSRQERKEVQALSANSPAQNATQTQAVAPLAAMAASAVSVSNAPAATPSLVSAVPSPGTPEAGPRLGQDVATPASAAAKPPPLNLNLPRPRGGELSSRGSSGVLQLLPTPPEQKSKLTQDMEKAAREDCRKAYGEQLGLLAVVPLALDAAKGNKGCRW
ncbi:hypothetical protein [Roseateles albus]|uniref:ESPR domain-containing protein n=1 Tax=Roseateles albus TaxID=2987525 RepID=A0ABT5KGJ4_9BURK|nr:hypothetical protein [Roseateles albus]MDC8772654.1 hypothetical protein [Roseateles albus]